MCAKQPPNSFPPVLCSQLQYKGWLLCSNQWLLTTLTVPTVQLPTSLVAKRKSRRYSHCCHSAPCTRRRPSFKPTALRRHCSESTFRNCSNCRLSCDRALGSTFTEPKLSSSVVQAGTAVLKNTWPARLACCGNMRYAYRRLL